MYISNWYIMGGLLWTIALIVIAYLPWYQQNGISETVIQGFYMHMGVGMWFTPIVLGLTYYALPRLLNKPIYSYSLGVLAFWTQMVFYSMIGAHHFIFAPIPGGCRRSQSFSVSVWWSLSPPGRATSF